MVPLTGSKSQSDHGRPHVPALDWPNIDLSRSSRDLARELGIDVSTINRWRRNLGLPRRYAYSSTLELVGTAADLAKRYGVAVGTISKWRRRQRFEVPPRKS